MQPDFAVGCFTDIARHGWLRSLGGQRAELRTLDHGGCADCLKSKATRDVPAATVYSHAPRAALFVQDNRPRRPLDRGKFAAVAIDRPSRDRRARRSPCTPAAQNAGAEPDATWCGSWAYALADSKIRTRREPDRHELAAGNRTISRRLSRFFLRRHRSDMRAADAVL